MKALIQLSEDIQIRCSKLRRHAEQPENRIPIAVVWSKDPEYRLDLPSTGHLVVFRIVLVEADKGPLPARWMAMTAGRSTPHPYAVWTIADQLGFTGAKSTDEGIVGRGPWEVSLEDVDANVWVIVRQLLEN